MAMKLHFKIILIIEFFLGKILKKEKIYLKNIYLLNNLLIKELFILI